MRKQRIERNLASGNTDFSLFLPALPPPKHPPQADSRGPTHAVARARSSAIASIGPRLCPDTYLPAAFAISMRQDGLARRAVLSTNFAINALSASSSSGRIVLARSSGV
jgi:hypothetical protein